MISGSVDAQSYFLCICLHMHIKFFCAAVSAVVLPSYSLPHAMSKKKKKEYAAYALDGSLTAHAHAAVASFQVFHSVFVF